MAIQVSGHIGKDDIREEGGKISWFSPNYPTIPDSMRLNISYGWAQNRDVNHQLGRNLNDDSVDWRQYFGWDTWRKPTIEYCYLHQYLHDGGIRIAWKTVGGDPWRTAWHILLSTTGYPVIPATLSLDYQYGAEHNPSSSDPKLQYSFAHDNDRNVQALATPADWKAFSIWGGYNELADNPQANKIIDPTNGAVEPSAMFSVVLPNVTADNTTSYNVTVVGIDGREADQLSDTKSANTLTLNRGGSYDAGITKKATYAPNWNYLDADAGGNNSIILFSDQGQLLLDEKTDSGASVELENNYLFYLGGQTTYNWVYVTDDVGSLNTHPYYPGDPDIPSDHYYEQTNPDDYTTFELGKWVQIQGIPIQITGLTPETSYDIFVCNFVDQDVGRYTINGNTFSAPTPERNDNAKKINITTDALTALQRPTTFVITSELVSGFHCSWDHSGEVAESFTFRYRINGGTWTSQDYTVSNKVNWVTSSNPKEADISFLTQPQTGDTYEIQVKATTTDTNFQNSLWSNTASYTF